MKRTPSTPVRLRDMGQEKALAHCVSITAQELTGMDDKHTRALWGVFKSYILNNYQDTGVTVPAEIRGIWDRCKAIIDREASL